MKISVENLSYSYPGMKYEALSNLSIKIEPDEKLAVMGNNGSGKTTFLKILAGILEPEKGKINIENSNSKLTSNIVTYTPENPKNGFFADTVKEEVEFFPKNLDRDFEKEGKRAMERVGIEHIGEKSPFSLSAGEEKKVSIASILSGNPQVLAIDEPARGLDRKGAREIGSLLKNLSRTVVFSTHSSDLAYEFADRVLILKDGKILETGNAKDVLSDMDTCKESGLQVPGKVKWLASREKSREGN